MCIRDSGVLVLRVKAQALVAVVDLLIVGDIVIVELRQHVLGNEPGDHIVRGDDDVIVAGAGLEQGIEGLVALSRLVVDLDAGFLLELINQILIDVFTPAAHVDDPLLFACLLYTSSGDLDRLCGGQRDPGAQEDDPGRAGL